MFTEVEIQELFVPVLKKIKDVGKNVKHIFDKNHPLIDFYPIYKEAVEAAEDIKVHTEVGIFPDNLFKEKAPNQTDAELKYIKGNYKEITLEVVEDFFGVLNRIWNRNNWSINFAEDDIIFRKNPAKKYFEEDYPVYGSIQSYFQALATPGKIKDANSVMIFRPKTIPTKKVEREGQTVLVVDDSVLIEPIAKIIPVKRVIIWKDSHVLILLEEKSMIEVGGKNKKKGLIFEFYDEVSIWKLEQNGKKEDYTFEIFEIYNHNLGFVPAIKLKGKPIERGDEVLYQSPLTSAIKPLDLAILDNSGLQIAKATIAYPRRWEIKPECEFKDKDGQPCIKGFIWAGGERKECPDCKGTGTKSLSTLLSVHEIAEPKPNEDAIKIPIPPFGREVVDVASMKFIRDEINTNLDKGREMLNKSKSTSSVKGGEPALSKQIDREEQFSFILGISDEIFQILAFAFKATGGMRYGDKFEQPDISPPTHFEIRTLEEVTLELANAIEKNLPQIIVRKLILEYIDIRFGTQPKKIELDRIVLFADRLVTLSETQVTMKKAGGSVSTMEVILHTSAYNFIAEAIIEDPKFLEKDKPEQRQILVDKAKATELDIKAASGNAQAAVEAAVEV